MASAFSAAALTVIVVLAMACSSPDLPPVAVQSPHLTEDDLEVMTAVLDQSLRPARDRMIELGQGPNRTVPKVTGSFLIFDSTIPSCLTGPILRRPGCVDPKMVDSLGGFRIQPSRLTREMFVARNRDSLPIRGRLGDDVTYIPTALAEDRECFITLLRKYPGAAIVVFSAPFYPTPTSAVIYYRLFWAGDGFVRLTRNGRRWSIAGTIGRQE